MAGFKAELINGADVNRRLGNRADTLRGRTRRAKVAWKRVAMLALSAVEADFSGLSKGQTVRGIRWKKVSFVTAALRRRGRGRKMVTMKDVERRRAGLPILVDSGLLRNSFTPGRKGNVLKIATNSVEVGTSDPKAVRLARSSRQRFHFTPEMEARLERNVQKAFGGRPGRTPTGRRSRAKKRWNRDFFLIRAQMRKMDKSGRGYQVPGRKLILRQPHRRRQKWADVYLATVTAE